MTSWLKYLAFPCWLQEGNGDLSWAEFQALALEACDTWRAGLLCKHKARRFVQVGELQGLKQPVSEEKLRLGCRLKSKMPRAHASCSPRTALIGSPKAQNLQGLRQRLDPWQ